MEKLDKLTKLLELSQNDTLTPKEVEKFLTLVLGVIKTAKDNFDKLSQDNLKTISESISYIEQYYSKQSEIFDSKSSDLLSTLNDKLALLNTTLKEVEAIKLIPGIDGYTPIKGVDYFDGQPGIPGNDGSPDTAEEIATKLESLEGDAKLDFSALKNVPEFKGGKSGGVVARNIYQLGDVSLTALANNDTLKWDDTNKLWVNGTGGGSSITLQINGTPNGSQSLLNLKQGSNVTITDDGVGGITIASTGGGTPGGSDTQLQYNNSGAFGGISGATTDGTKVTLTAPIIATSLTASYATLSTVPYFDASKNLVSSSVTPTELGYLSGVTGGIQTQLASKEPTITSAGANTVWHGDKTFSAVVEADISLSANTTNNVSLTKHGFMSQLPGGTTLFYRADGTFAAPASVAVPNGYLSEAFAYLANTVHSITHNFGAYPVVQAFDSTGNMVVPLVIQNTDANTVAVTFTSAATYTLVLTIGSPQLQSYISTAIDYSAGVTDRIIAVTAGGKTITLPTANVSRTGYEYKIDNSSTGTVNVVGQGGELIQGLASQTIPSDSCMTIYANGTAWRFN